MLFPLILGGAGRLSVDHLIGVWRGSARRNDSGLVAWGLVLLVLGATLMFLLPWLGGALASTGAVLLVVSRRRSNPGRRPALV